MGHSLLFHISKPSRNTANIHRCRQCLSEKTLPRIANLQTNQTNPRSLLYFSIVYFIFHFQLGLSLDKDFAQFNKHSHPFIHCRHLFIHFSFFRRRKAATVYLHRSVHTRTLEVDSSRDLIFWFFLCRNSLTYLPSHSNPPTFPTFLIPYNLYPLFKRDPLALVDRLKLYLYAFEIKKTAQGICPN